MKINISINERLGIANILNPNFGTRKTQKDFIEIKKTIKLTDEEIKMYGIRQTQQGIVTDGGRDVSERKELEFKGDCLKSLLEVLIVMEGNKSFPECGAVIIDELEALFPAE